MKKFFMKFLDIRFLSLVFAILIWYYVIGVQGPIITRTFKVPITPINLGSGVFITNSPKEVSVTAEGSSKAILGIKGTDFTALVNLAGKSEGEFYVPVDVKPPTSSIKIKSVSPEKVKIELEKIVVKKFPITVKFKGTPSENFIPAMPIITPDTVSVTGPLSKIDEISHIEVDVDLTGMDSETTVVRPIQIVPKENANINNVQVNPATCVVKIVASNPNITKTVPIVPDIVGQPFQGFGVKAVSTTPLTVTIQGKFKDVNSIDFIKTAPVDISGISKTSTFKPALSLPEGVNGSINTCSVEVQVEPLKSIIITVPITVNYNSVAFDADVSTKEIKVMLTGFKEALDTISKNSITAVVDVSQFTEGTYTVPVSINGLPDNTVISITEPESVQITLTKKGGG